MEVFDTDTRDAVVFPLSELSANVRLFGCLVEEPSARLEEQSPVNREAAERMARLHQSLDASGFRGHKLQLLLVRLIFCHFADDAKIFAPSQFERYLRNRTSLDGTDVGPRLNRLFEVLDTPEDERSSALDADLADFPYINGGLFREVTGMPDFDEKTRMLLLQTCKPDWSLVSPAIFGSMFQGVMDDDERHEVGAHYTSEENILKAIQPLFLDDLYREFEEVRGSRKGLLGFHDRLASLGFLDPACGCGNFLVIAYRELRRLELRVIAEIQRDQVTLTDVSDLLRVSVEQFSGIELVEFPALIAQTAMWLTDHQMNLEASNRFGRFYARIPLTEGANIVCGDALEIEWTDVRPAEKTDYVIGNPPFLGSRVMSPEQKTSLRAVARGIRQAGFLDFVAGWYLLASKYSALNPTMSCALVSTSSISQGEQPGILWPRLYADGQHIVFAHRSFVWTNEARGVAKVHCVVIGFSRRDRQVKQLFSYQPDVDEPILELVDSISPYLVPGGEYVVGNRESQIVGAPKMDFGNMAADGGNLLLSQADRDDLIQHEPQAEEWIKPFVGSFEFINDQRRFCLWLEGIQPGELRNLPLTYARVQATKKVREKSARPHLAATPHLFAQITQDPSETFLLVPRTSSRRRAYIPMGFFEPGTVASDGCLVVKGASLFEFGVMTSRTHMDWVRVVGGRLKSDYRYSKDVVYNNFVFPTVSDSQRAEVSQLAAAVLEARNQHPTSTLADLYDEVSMPSDLRAAHVKLDRYIDILYGFSPMTTSRERVSHLLVLNHRASEQGGK
jgi:hypothetical protein